MTSTSCQICGSTTKLFCELKIQGKLNATFLQCVNCQHVFAESPTWLAGSFGQQLSRLDIGALDRSLIVADFAEVIARAELDSAESILDWGGGYGILTRLLRDRGLEVWHHDPFTEPLFAGAAVGDHGRHGMIVLSEVALHFTDPVKEFAELLKRTDYVLFTAVVVPEDAPRDWWYLMPDTGQHVCLFSTDSLNHLARELGVRIISDGRFFHLLHRPRVRMRTKMYVRFRGLVFVRAALYYMERVARRALGRSRSKLATDQSNLIAELPWNQVESQ